MAKEMGAMYRLGPELEVTGYSCEDHFHEIDTIKHSWQTMAEILKDKDLTKDILCDIGMPVMFRNALYNCRVMCLNQEILMIRPKMYLADGSNNYRENRWFTAWPPSNKEMLEFQMPAEIAAIKGQKNTLFGNGVI